MPADGCDHKRCWRCKCGLKWSSLAPSMNHIIILLLSFHRQVLLLWLLIFHQPTGINLSQRDFSKPLPMVPRYHSWKGHVWWFLILTTAVATIPTERTLNRTGSLLELPSKQFHPHNSSLPEVKIGRAVCDPVRAGSALRRTSCEEAATRIPASDLIIRFARRGPTIHEVQIPRRFSSGTFPT